MQNNSAVVLLLAHNVKSRDRFCYFFQQHSSYVCSDIYYPIVHADLCVGWVDGRMDGRTDGRTDGWMDGWTRYI